ncbi:MAG: hypothetical protein IJS91_00265 [Bacteroidales bacterium]|nr:hypothetical protein [Bacteroidales bacterium]
MNLSDFITFNPLTDVGKSIPPVSGNYLVTIRDITALPSLGYKLVTQQFRGRELIYTGITESSLYRRIWKNHIGSHAGSSTLRLTLGCLFGYTLIPRDKKTPNNGHVRFSPDDERGLRSWMKENLIFHFLPNDAPKALESELIARFNPPLNLSENENLVNSDFRATVSALRGQRPWQSI